MSRLKIEYSHYRFSVGEGGATDEVTIRDTVIPRVERFKYLGSIIQEGGEIDEDMNQLINIGWQQKYAFGVSCDKKIH